MKTTALTIALFGLIATSCMKSKTCTCKDSAGKTFYQETKKTTNKSDLEKFESDCKASNKPPTQTCELT